MPHVALAPAVAGRSIALFPLVGAGLGAFAGTLGLLLDRWLPAGAVAVLLIAAVAMVTGGLHLDGLMDTADGLGGRTAEQRLAIMRDSRAGAFGVIATVLVVLGQFACLSELRGRERFLALVLALVLSRWAMVIALTLFPAARPGGLGAAFQDGASRTSAVAGTLLALPFIVLGGQSGLLALAIAAVLLLVCGTVLARNLGGLTGDCYGAIAVVTETAVLFATVAMVRG